MKKIVISILAATSVAVSAFTFVADAEDAKQTPGAPRMSQLGFIFDAKLAGMKAELKLTPDQEKLWPAFGTAVRDAHAARVQMMRDRREGMENGERPSPIAVMTEMSEHLAKISAELKTIVDAAKPLYDSFDDTQKRRFGPLLLMLRQESAEPAPHGERAPKEANPL